MLPLKVSWSGQTFAFARCSDSREKKHRQRLTKEERRATVEFFIKKYQNSNNGNFPSLNLTQKEVGGSFYTVREIVREIIQENKVLGPGSPTSKSLNLEDCLEEYAVGSLSMDPHAPDREQKESYPLSSEHQILSKVSYEIVNSETPDSLASHPNGCPVSTVMYDKSSDHLDQNFSSATYLDENLMDEEPRALGTPFLDYEEANPRGSSDQTHDNSGTREYIYSEVQVPSSKDCNNHKVEHPVLLGKSVSITYPSGELGVNEYDIGNKSNSIAGTINSFAESNDVSEIMEQDILPETKTLSNSGNNNMSSALQGYSASATREVLQLASTAAKTCNSDEISAEAEDSTSSIEVLGEHSFSNEVEVASVLADKVLVIKRTEMTENLSSNLINEAAATRLTSPMSHTSRSTKVEAHSVLQPSKTDNIAANTESALCESLSPEVKGTPSLSVKAEDQYIASRSDRESSSSSISSGKAEELEKEETNSVWAAVKSFVAAVIKFWTE